MDVLLFNQIFARVKPLCNFLKQDPGAEKWQDLKGLLKKNSKISQQSSHSESLMLEKKLLGKLYENFIIQAKRIFWLNPKKYDSRQKYSLQIL